ncbi:MAG TPA: queuosine salvage family protein, partial [Solirubrobacteraceae bacterium]|nr:queuosine salvage family protein [Solirubrobacteraceae bacterium]
MDLCDEVRAHCARVAAQARWVRIGPQAPIEPGGTAGLDPALHLLDAAPEAVARYVLILDAINFGSGWFGTLRTEPGEDDLTAITRRLTAHARAAGEPWTAAQLRELDAPQVAEVLGQDPAHELMALFADALVALGGWLGHRGALEAVDAEGGGSAARLAASLAAGMPFFADHGFYKRAQITANDLALAGVAAFADIDRLTIFADNLVPHVLRVDGMLAYAPELAAKVDAGEELAAGSEMETELRACAVHACELLAARWGVAPR